MDRSIFRHQALRLADELVELGDGFAHLGAQLLVAAAADLRCGESARSIRRSARSARSRA